MPPIVSLSVRLILCGAVLCIKFITLPGLVGPTMGDTLFVVIGRLSTGKVRYPRSVSPSRVEESEVRWRLPVRLSFVEPLCLRLQRLCGRGTPGRGNLARFLRRVSPLIVAIGLVISLLSGKEALVTWPINEAPVLPLSR